jgi:hypothetical protein
MTIADASDMPAARVLNEATEAVSTFVRLHDHLVLAALALRVTYGRHEPKSETAIELAAVHRSLGELLQVCEQAAVTITEALQAFKDTGQEQAAPAAADSAEETGSGALEASGRQVIH